MISLILKRSFSLMKSTMSYDSQALQIIKDHSLSINDCISSIVADFISNKKEIILIGESSHGTSEHYQFRSKLTKELICTGFCQAVLIEADLPDTTVLNSYVMGRSTLSLDQSFLGFERFPTWMWANEGML